MSEEESAVISENQNNKAHSLTDFIIFYFKDIDSENDSNVKKTESK